MLESRRRKRVSRVVSGGKQPLWLHLAGEAAIVSWLPPYLAPLRGFSLPVVGVVCTMHKESIQMYRMLSYQAI